LKACSVLLCCLSPLHHRQSWEMCRSLGWFDGICQRSHSFRGREHIGILLRSLQAWRMTV
jgi:hypothetical protein